MRYDSKIELLTGFHQIKPIRAIDKYNSRFAYKIFINKKPIAGEWKIDSVNINKRTYTYLKLNRKKQGWHKESKRHSLAARGIKTKRKRYTLNIRR